MKKCVMEQLGMSKFCKYCLTLTKHPSKIFASSFILSMTQQPNSDKGMMKAHNILPLYSTTQNNKNKWPIKFKTKSKN